MAKSENAEGTLSADERAAVKERVAELKAEAKRGKKAADSEADLLAKIAEMQQPDRGLAERIHEIVKATAPELTPKTWYGMPAYAKDDKILFFFQPGEKFKTRYSTIGFESSAMLDDGEMWPVGFALLTIGDAEEKKIVALLKKALR